VLDRELTKLGITHTFRYLGNESLITRARNWFANLALIGKDENGKPFTHLLFVDADIIFSPAIVVEMFQANLPTVALPYSKKGVDWANVATAAKAGVPADQLPHYAGSPVFGIEGEFDLSKPTPAVAVGTGVMLIQVSVLRALADANPDWKYRIGASESSSAVQRAMRTTFSKWGAIRRPAITFPKIIGSLRKPKSWGSRRTCFHRHKQCTAEAFSI